MPRPAGHPSVTDNFRGFAIFKHSNSITCTRQKEISRCLYIKDAKKSAAFKPICIFSPIGQSLSSHQIPVTKISIPIAIRMTPPSIVAFSESLSPNFFPKRSPIMQITNVTAAMISELENAAPVP